jgi:hypothetical protein
VSIIKRRIELNRDIIMKKVMLTLLVAAPLLILSGCAVDTVSYNDGYVGENVYTAGYYDSSPYWGNTYYTGYGWNNPGLLGGVAWGGSRWGNAGWNHGGYGHRGWGHGGFGRGMHRGGHR